MYSGKSGCIRTKLVLVGQSGLILGINCFYRVKLLHSDKSGCIWAKVFVFGQKRVSSGKVVVFRQLRLYSGKVVAFW